MLKSYRIVEARDGGYIVTDDGPENVWTNRILFAGGLSEALNYLSETFRGIEHTPQAERKLGFAEDPGIHTMHAMTSSPTTVR